MPTYSYRNTNTNEEFDVVMPMSEMDQYEKDNPHLQRIYSKMNIVDPVTVGALKPPSDFRHVLNKVAKMPGADSSKIFKRWTYGSEV